MALMFTIANDWHSNGATRKNSLESRRPDPTMQSGLVQQQNA